MVSTVFEEELRRLMEREEDLLEQQEAVLI
jgi:hypothetical protein